ncbi:hypothetical protein KSP39_PZI014058 [Platanthera zijinensis]|uniref:Uncharacterized protein n=1 Tax=Platanthera zijinensis TaxID=2320716 RepID=A0AAP0BBW9_9ASPA
MEESSMLASQDRRLGQMVRSGRMDGDAGIANPAMDRVDMANSSSRVLRFSAISSSSANFVELSQFRQTQPNSSNSAFSSSSAILSSSANFVELSQFRRTQPFRRAQPISSNLAFSSNSSNFVELSLFVKLRLHSAFDEHL